MAIITGTRYNDNDTFQIEPTPIWPGRPAPPKITFFPRLEGTEDDDRISGLRGHDIILGNGGDDLIVGGSGDDTMTGGAGADRFRIESQWEGMDTITDFNWREADKIIIDLSGFGGASPEDFSSEYDAAANVETLYFGTTAIAKLTGLNYSYDFGIEWGDVEFV